MVELGQDFQNISPFLQGWLLYIPGIVLVLIGLWIGLAGSSRMVLCSSLIMAIIGLVCSLFLGVRLILAPVFALVAMTIGAILPKPAILIVSGLFAGIVVILFLNSTQANLRGQISRFTISVPQHLDTTESLKTIEEFSLHSINQFKKVIKNFTINQIAYCGGAFLITVFLGIFLSDIIVKLFCAVLGTALCIKGMFLLLCYKGTDSVNIVIQKPNFYAQVFIAIALVGFLIQVIFVSIPKKKSKKDKDKDKESEADK